MATNAGIYCQVPLGAKKDKTPDEVVRHEELKAAMANRLQPLSAEETDTATVV